jgi:hypothetical protein
MRLIASCTLAILASIPCVAAEKPARPATADDVVVKRLDLQMPADPAKEGEVGHPPREKFLWDHFLNREGEPSFGHITTKAWRPVAKKFRAALVAKARKMNFPAKALDQALQAIAISPLNEKLAVIPVGAYLIRDGGQDVWVVVCNWEDDLSNTKVIFEPTPTLDGTKSGPERELRPEERWLPIAHRRVFVFSVRTMELLEFTTCM